MEPSGLVALELALQGWAVRGQVLAARSLLDLAFIAADHAKDVDTDGPQHGCTQMSAVP
jgi:hypothetical protein